MRKPVLIALIVVIVALAAVATVAVLRYQRTATENNDLRLAKETAQVGYSEAFSAITEIQDSLNAIAVGDSTVQMLSEASSPPLSSGAWPEATHVREATWTFS